jgi:hypothetical protein
VTTDDIARGRRRAGPASRSTRCSRASARSCCSMEETPAASASSARTRRSQAVADAVRRARVRAAGPEPADRLVPVPRPDRRRQDRAGQGAGRVPVRRRAGDGRASTCPSTWRSTPSPG